jgi:hypothetical protein
VALLDAGPLAVVPLPALTHGWGLAQTMMISTPSP